MSNSAIWKSTLAPAGRREPLAFVMGMRNPVAAGSYCGDHAHAAVEIVFHPTGRGETRTASKRWRFTEGSAVVYAPEERHDQTVEKSGEDLCVHVAVPEAARRRLREGFFLPLVNRGWVGEEIRQLCRSRGHPRGLDHQIFDLRATAVLLAVVDMATQANQQEVLPPAERHVRLAEQFMAEHFSTLRSLQEVADFVGVGHDHLRHVFQVTKGRSLVAYLNEVKIARAKVLLSSSPLPLKQIATLCGFRDEYYFSAVFRRLVKISPGAWRRAA